MYRVENANISQLTTIRIGGTAEFLFYPDNLDELVGLIVELQDRNIKWSILGGGSNSIVSSHGVKGAVICTSGLNWINRVSPDCVSVGAGVKMPIFSGQMAQLGLSGAEFMEGIPGTIGGAIIMNAGAHGQATSNILEKITIFDTVKGQISTLPTSSFSFEYRFSNIDPCRFVILEAKFRLNYGTIDQIQDKIKLYRSQRAKTQPKGFSAGCMFRNPQGLIPAGKLIDEMGMKGQRIGGAEVSLIHANFIMNTSGASSGQVCGLINKIQSKAWQNKGIWLQPEVWGIGDFPEEEKVIWLHPEQRTA